MKRTPLQVLSLQGSPVDIAFALGRERCKRIERAVLFWNRFLAEKFRGRRDRLRTLERSFFAAARRMAPHYLDEIAAMAEGARVPFADLFRLNCTELHTYADEKCTTLAFPVATKRKQAILLAHNEDWDPRRSDVFVLRATLPTLSYAIIAYDGYLPGLSSGLNSSGLAHAVNFLKPADARAGLPRIFITRHLVTATGIDDCLRWIQKAERAFGQSIHLAHGARYVGLELTAQHAVVRRLTLPMAHANHYLAKSLQPFATHASRSSALRLKVAQRFLRDAVRDNGRTLTSAAARACAKKILSDRSAHPYAIWREADHPEEMGATLVTNMIQTDRPALELYRHRPLDASPLRVAL